MVTEFILIVSEIKAVSALLGISGVALYRGCTTRTKTTRGQTFKALFDPILVSGMNPFSLFKLVSVFRKLSHFLNLFLATVAAIYLGPVHNHFSVSGEPHPRLPCPILVLQNVISHTEASEQL